MKKFLLLAFLFATPALAQYTTPSGGFDTYHGLASTTCTHGTATAFSLATVNVSGHTNKVLCDFSGHVFYLKSFFTFDNNIPGGGDENGSTFTYAHYVGAKYPSQQSWADSSIARFLTWGYTGLAPGRATSVTNPWTTANPVPYIAGSDISTYSVANPQGFSTTCLAHNLSTSLKTTGFGGQTTGVLVDYISPCWGSWYLTFLNNDNAFTVGSQSTAMKHFLIAVSDTDSDNSHCFGAGPDFVPANGNYDFRCGIMGLYLPPEQFADSSNSQIYTDPTIYLKKTFHDNVMSLRSTIAAVNTAYGSSYTTDLTSGNCFGPLQPSWLCPSPGAALSLGTGTGTALSFTGTTANTTVSEFSVYIANVSTLVAGDMGDANGTIYGKTTLQASLTAAVTNGSPTVTCSSCTSFNTSGAWNGAKILLGGVQYTISTVGSTSSLTLTGNYAAATGTTPMLFNFVKYTTGVISVMFASGQAPANGNAITAGYVQNGWGIGTGFMDEDCRAAHSSYCINNSNANIFYTGFSAGLKSDMKALSKSNAVGYASQATASIATWASAKGFTGKVMHAGIYTLGSWGAPPDSDILQGLAPYQDIIIASGSGNGFSKWSLGMIDYVNTNWGDVPIIETSYRVSNRDDSFDWRNNSCTATPPSTTVSCTLPSPIRFTTGDLIDAFCANTSYNRLQAHPSSVAGLVVTYTSTSATTASSTTCDIQYSDNNEGGFNSQNARGTDYKNDVGNAPTVAYTATGTRMFIGVIQWAWQDYWNEHLNWGVVTVRDNPLNGIDDSGPGTFACQPPDNTHNCGGETSAHLASGAPMGDFLSLTGQAHVSIDNYFLGTSPIQPPTGVIATPHGGE